MDNGKKRYMTAAIILTVIVLFVAGRMAGKQKLSFDVRYYVDMVQGASANIDGILNASSDAVTAVYINGADNYFYAAIIGARNVVSLSEEQMKEFNDFDHQLEQYYDDIYAIFEGYNSGKKLTADDRQYLESARDAMNSWIGNMQIAAGEQKARSDIKNYILTAEGVTANIDGIFTAETDPGVGASISGVKVYLSHMLTQAHTVHGLTEEKMKEFNGFRRRLEQYYDDIDVIFERYDIEKKFTGEDRQYLEQVRDSIASWIGGI